MTKPRTWGDVYWGHIIASRGMMDRCDAAYRADQWLERQQKAAPDLPDNADGRPQVRSTFSGSLATAQAAEVLEMEVVHLQALIAELAEALKDARHLLWELGVGEEALQPIRSAIAKVEAR